MDAVIYGRITDIYNIYFILLISSISAAGLLLQRKNLTNVFMRKVSSISSNRPTL